MLHFYQGYVHVYQVGRLVKVDETSVQRKGVEPTRLDIALEQDAEPGSDVFQVGRTNIVAFLGIASVTVDCWTCYLAAQSCLERTR